MYNNGNSNSKSDLFEGGTKSMKKWLPVFLSLLLVVCNLNGYTQVYASEKDYEYAYINYGYYDRYTDRANGTITLSLITEAGHTEYKLATDVIFYGNDGKSIKLACSDAISDATECLAETVWEDVCTSQENVGDALEDFFRYSADNKADDTALRVVRFTTDSDGHILSLAPLMKLTSGGSGLKYSVEENAVCSSSESSIGTSGLISGAPILKLDSDDFDISDFYDADYLIDGAVCSAIVVDADSDSKYHFAVVYDGNPLRNKGVTSLTYDGYENCVNIVTGETYSDAVVCALGYNKGKLVSLETVYFPIYDDDLRAVNVISFRNDVYTKADTVKIMVLKSKKSIQPLCKTYEFGMDYLEKYRYTYGYITDAYYDSAEDESNGKVTLSLVTKNGYVNYPVADSIKFVGSNGESVELGVNDAISNASEKLAGTSWESFDKMDLSVGDALESVFSKEILVHDNDDAALRTAYIFIDENGEIESVTPLIFSDEYSDHIDYATFSGSYDEDTGKAGSKTFSDKSTIIYINYEDPSKTTYLSNASLMDEWEYDGLAIDSDDNQMYHCTVITDYTAKLSQGDSIGIVKSNFKYLGKNGEVCNRVTVFKDNQEVELNFSGSIKNGKFYGSDTECQDLDIGSVIIYSADTNNNVHLYDVVGNVEFAGGAKDFCFDNGFKNGFSKVADYTDGEAYFYGYIADYSYNNVKIVVADAISDGTENNDTETFYYDDNIQYALDVLVGNLKNANQYTLSGTRKSSAEIYPYDYRVGCVAEMYLCEEGNEGVEDDEFEVFNVLIKTYKGEVTDIISLDVPMSSVTVVTPFDGTRCE